jgi:hypothetical protein
MQAGTAAGGQALVGGMMSAGGKAQGLNFDHVLHRLQVGPCVWGGWLEADRASRQSCRRARRRVGS